MVHTRAARRAGRWRVRAARGRHGRVRRPAVPERWSRPAQACVGPNPFHCKAIGSRSLEDAQRGLTAKQRGFRAMW